jgi:pimeloyl-ACP methyl ester carboxylesterase
MSGPRLRALLACCVLALAACSSGGAQAKSTTTSTSTKQPAASGSALQWKQCPSGECAMLPVPLDAAQPGGRQIDLALVRVPAGKPAERIGSLLVNPGGPGAPGADYAQQVASQLPQSITDRFDIVGWDPRGTGSSSPVDCGKKLDYLFNADSAPDNAAERAALEAASRRFAQACASRSGDLLGHIASIDTVHDMDRIRAALGDDKLTYAGFSYGTYLGALYAKEYPSRVRALVLDGAIDPAIPVDQVAIQQAKGFDASLDAFLKDCARQKSCAFHQGGNPRAALDAFRARIEQSPMKSDNGRILGPTQLDIALAAPLYAGAGGYHSLATALRDAEGGDPKALLGLFDNYMDRSSDGTYSPEWPAFLAISCLDGPDLQPAAADALLARAAEEAPYFGASNVGLGFPCSFWPVPPINAVAGPVSAPGTPPIVVIGTTGDPVTPIAWAENLARELGNARLVTVNGTAHTSSLDGNPCLDAANSAYLVRLQAPRSGLHCKASG